MDTIPTTGHFQEIFNGSHKVVDTYQCIVTHRNSNHTRPVLGLSFPPRFLHFLALKSILNVIYAHRLQFKIYSLNRSLYICIICQVLYDMVAHACLYGSKINIMNERVVFVVNDVVLPSFNFNELIKRLSIQMMHRLKVVMQMMSYYYY